MNTSLSENSSAPRLKQRALSTPAWAALAALQQAANRTQLDPKLLESVRMRASQINRCAFCLELHARTAVAHGERPERLHLLGAWEEVSSFSPRERAALRWTEALTRLPDSAVSDAVFAEASAQFTETELLELTMVIIAINSWNRVNVAFRVPPDPNYWPEGKTRVRMARESVASGATAATTLGS